MWGSDQFRVPGFLPLSSDNQHQYFMKVDDMDLNMIEHDDVSSVVPLMTPSGTFYSK